MSERKSSCDVEGGRFVRPCAPLSECVSGTAFDKQKGVIEWNFIDMKKGEASRTFFGIRSGIHAVKGIAFNWCPFCGTKIDAPFCDAAESSGAELQKGARDD